MVSGIIIWTYWWHLTKHARRKWKVKLTKKGLKLGRGARLTNLRHADGLMILATSRGELIIMGEGRKNFPYLGCNWMAWKRRFGRPPPYKKQFIFKYVGLWFLFFVRRHDIQISGPQFSKRFHCVCAASFISTNSHCWTNTCFSDWGCNFSMQLCSQLLCLVSLHCRWRRTNWTWHNNGCWCLWFVPHEPLEIKMRRVNQKWTTPRLEQSIICKQCHLATIELLRINFRGPPLGDWVRSFPSAPSKKRGWLPKRWGHPGGSLRFHVPILGMKWVEGNPKLWPMVSCGVSICPKHVFSTEIRCANNLMLSTKNDTGLSSMVESLVGDAAAAGSQPNYCSFPLVVMSLK